MTLNFSDEDIISGYFPFRNEVSIIPFLKFLTKKGITVCLPSIQKRIFTYFLRNGNLKILW